MKSPCTDTTRRIAGALAATALLLCASTAAYASSHREAPAISEDPAVDDTDPYAFVSPENPDKVVLVGNWFPAEEPSGGPNYFRFSDAARYQINIDNDGQLPVDDMVYEFAFSTEVQSPENPADPTVGTFLAATGTIESLDDPNYNLRQYFTVTKIVDGVRGAPITQDVGGRRLLSPPNNIGPFSTPNYGELAAEAVYDIGNGVRVFAGQRDDPFFLDLGAVFDGLQVRPVTGTLYNDNPARLGQPGGGRDALAGFNVHTIAIEVPINQLLDDPEQPIIGMYTSASRPTMSVLNPDGTQTHSDEFVQVSRLGFPLANELFGSIPTIKDQYNRAEPGEEFDRDVLLPRVRNPELTNLFKGLFPQAFSTMNLPPQDQRADLVAAIFTGVPDLNMIGTNPAPADLLRLNTSLGAAKEPDDEGYSPLGVIAGDATGFPNGRRPWDDIVDIELRVVAGVLYQALIAPQGPNYNVAPNNLLADGVDVNDRTFLAVFPFLAEPSGGKDTVHAGPVQGNLEVPTATITATATATATATVPPTNTPTVRKGDGGGGCHISVGGVAPSAWALLIPAALLIWRRRK